jgi:antitoxin (DNA-binding transcriptional repressor) of toxin-antitoxin stability system
MKVDVSAAAANLPELIDRVIRGATVTITRDGRALAQLSKAKSPRKPRVLGQLAGRVSIAEDFDGPLPPDLCAALEGGD